MDSIINKKKHKYAPVEMPQVKNPDYKAGETRTDEPRFIDKPRDEFNYTESMKLKIYLVAFHADTRTLEDDLKWADQILMGQSDENAVVRMKTFDEYENINRVADPIRRLSLIRDQLTLSK